MSRPVGQRRGVRGALGAIGAGALTPMLDALFLLLFAVLALSDSRAARAADDEEQVLIQLPPVEAGDGGGGGELAPQPITLTLDASGAIHLEPGDVAVDTRAALDRALAAQLGSALPEELVVRIRADRSAPYGTAVELLQHLRQRGFSDVQLLALGADAPSERFGETAR